MKLRLLFSVLLGFSLISINIRAQNIEWAKTIGGNGVYEVSQAMTCDEAGNIYTTGYFQGKADFDPGQDTFMLTAQGSLEDVFISKFDPLGNFIWAKQFSGKRTETADAIAVDAAGNIYTVGYFSATTDFDPGSNAFNLTVNGEQVSTDMFISKLSANGEFIWAKQIGGISKDFANSLAIDAGGNIYIAGKAAGEVDFDPSEGVHNIPIAGHSGFILKLDSSGHFTWVKQIGGSVESIAIDIYNRISVIGIFQNTLQFSIDDKPYSFTSNGDDDVFLAQFDKDGNLLWNKQIGGGSKDFATSVAVDVNANVYISGTFKESVAFTNKDINIVTLTTGKGDEDNFIAKLSNSGEFVWVKQIGINSYCLIYNMIVDANGNVYYTGGFGGTTDFNPDETTFNLTSAGDNDIFITKLGSNGDFLWAKRIGGQYQDIGTSIALDLNENIFVSGHYGGTVDFGSEKFSTVGGYDLFVLKINQSKTDITITPENVDFLIFPNPTSDKITIENPFKTEQNIHIGIYMLEGNLLKEFPLMPQPKLHIDLSDQPQGTYLLKLTSGSESFMAKVNIVK